MIVVLNPGLGSRGRLRSIKDLVLLGAQSGSRCARNRSPIWFATKGAEGAIPRLLKRGGTKESELEATLNASERG